jgi:hypothetical protein
MTQCTSTCTRQNDFFIWGTRPFQYQIKETKRGLPTQNSTNGRGKGVKENSIVLYPEKKSKRALGLKSTGTRPLAKRFARYIYSTHKQAQNKDSSTTPSSSCLRSFTFLSALQSRDRIILFCPPKVVPMYMNLHRALSLYNLVPFVPFQVKWILLAFRHRLHKENRSFDKQHVSILNLAEPSGHVCVR